MKNYFPKRIHRVYIDATIPSNLVARLSRDPKIAEWQRITWQFWEDPRFEFILSDLIIDEISVGNANQVAARQQIIAGLTVVATGALEFEIAEHLISEKAIPQRAFTDALHVAIAATHNIPYLATWNFTHLANPHTRPKIERICRNAGHSPPRIDSPKAILEGL